MFVAVASALGLLLRAPLLACVAGLAGPRGRWSTSAAAVATAAGLAAGVGVAFVSWAHGVPVSLDLSRFSPFPLVFSLDRLSCFFLFIVFEVSIPPFVYSWLSFAPYYSASR